MTSPSVSINVFGSTRAQIDGQRVNLGSRGQRAVLARLVAAGPRVVSTDLLIEDLWAGDPPPRALGALQVHVSNLRRALEPNRPPRTPASVLVSAPPGYALNLPDESVDVWNFEHLLDTGADESAIQLWVDGPYSEVADSSWAKIEIIRLEHLRRGAVDRHAENLMRAGRFAAASADLEAVVREAPDREESVRLLATALYYSGRQADALSVLRRSRDYLADEMGVDPSPALRTLESDILAHTVPTTIVAAPPKPRAPSTVVAAAPTGNGRPEELRKLLADAEAASTSRLRLAWIGGEAGDGKSTLATMLTASLVERGWNVAWGRSLEIDGAPPAWAWSEVLTELSATAGMDAAMRERLAPILPDDDQPVLGAVQPFWLGKWVADYLESVARLTPTAIVLDDIHRADALTVSILRQLASRARTERLFVVATYRRSEITEDLMSAWATLVDVPASRLELEGLGRDHIAAVAHSFGLDRITGATLDLIEERTGGNPLFVRELARLIASEGTRAAQETVPTGIGDVLRRRFSRLPERTLSTLRRLSVLGRGSDLDTLLVMTNSDEDQLLDDLEPAVLAGLLTEPATDRVHFTHALVRDTLYFDLPHLRRRRAHAHAYEVLHQRLPDDLAAHAHHAALGATPTTARAYARVIVAAARHAEAYGSHKDALALWLSAVNTLDLAPGDTGTERLELLIPLVASLARAANTVEARARRAEAIDIAVRLGDRRALLDAVTSWRAPVIWHIRGGVADERVLAPLRDLLADPEATARDRALLLVTSVFEVEGLDSTTASAQASEAVALAETIDDPEVLCMALNAFGYIAFGPDHDDDRVLRARQLLSVATEHGFADYQALAHFQLFLACNSVVDLFGARAHVKEAVRFASGTELTQLLGVLSIFGGLVDVLAGRFESARARYDAVATYMDEQGSSNGFEIRHIGRLATAIATDDYDEILRDLPALDRDLPVRVRNAWVLALARTGDLDRAREIWVETEPYQRDYYWRGMTALRAHAAAALGDIDVCRQCYDELLPYTGTFAGVDSGSLYCGPVDAALAATAAALGLDSAAEHAAAAHELIAFTREVLADPGWVDGA
ncbi:MAG: BTAD domain-containing putative transcriptional regulator [Rhodococcus sp. (in: high G+C Gram-positive bacteria)]